MRINKVLLHAVVYDYQNKVEKCRAKEVKHKKSINCMNLLN